MPVLTTADASEENPEDIHVYPTYGKEHACSRTCWCIPELDFTSDNGVKVWVHREDN